MSKIKKVPSPCVRQTEAAPSLRELCHLYTLRDCLADYHWGKGEDARAPMVSLHNSPGANRPVHKGFRLAMFGEAVGAAFVKGLPVRGVSPFSVVKIWRSHGSKILCRDFIPIRKELWFKAWSEVRSDRAEFSPDTMDCLLLAYHVGRPNVGEAGLPGVWPRVDVGVRS